MNYFEILDLGVEPFSNSPDPDFLYRSKGHEQCLHGLEISLRLRRGLSVVLGEVGTGKTTLCRELLRELEDDDAITAHLVLDPGFSSPAELLAVLHGLFHGGNADGLSEWQLKENIKNSIFEHAADDNQVLALLIDEGQKLPQDCLEVLRELLNYETNDRKLLQIVIFAQTEFRKSLEAMPNLADRVNEIIRLHPLGQGETKAMVRHRLDRAKKEYAAPELFTGMGYLALYRLTGGHPRRIVRLAHKVVLALIMREKRKAGWRLVHACASNGELASIRRARTALLVAVCLLALAVWPAQRYYPPLAQALAPVTDKATALATIVFGPGGDAPGHASGETKAGPAPKDVIAAQGKSMAVGAASPARPAASAPAAQPTSESAPEQRDAPVQTAIPGPQTPNGEKAMADALPATDTAQADGDAAAAQDRPLVPDAELLGMVPIQKGESISLLARAVYGSLTKDIVDAVLQANMNLGDPTILQAGDMVRMPLLNLQPHEAWWVPLEQTNTLAQAIDLWRATRHQVDVRVLAHRQHSGRLKFTLIAGWPRGTRKAAGIEAKVAGVRVEPIHGEALLMADM